MPKSARPQPRIKLDTAAALSTVTALLKAAGRAGLLIHPTTQVGSGSGLVLFQLAKPNRTNAIEWVA